MKDIMQSTKPWIEELMTAGYKVIVISEKIPSEMEVAPRYKLLTLLTLLKLFGLFLSARNLKFCCRASTEYQVAVSD